MDYILKIPLEITNDPARKENIAHLSFSDNSIDVKNENDVIVGSIRGCIGGGIEFEIVEDGRTFYASVFVLWENFCNMMGRKDLIVRKKGDKNNV